MLEPSSEPIIQRLHKLTDAINSISVDSTDNANPRRFFAKEGLLDALLALYDECNNDELKKNNNISKFVEKYRSTVHELRQFRVNVNDFEQKKVIGRGHFGIVQVVQEKQTGNVYALKILQKSETLAQQHISFYEEERDIMAKATSPWITHLQHAFQDERHLYILMDFHPGGDLLSLMDRLSYTFSEEMTRFYLAEIAVAIHALHTMGYVHRDIKPDNILIDRVGHIKLADFGSAAKLTASRLVRSDMALGTPEYIAPELLTSMNKTLTRDSSYGAECDFWSLGIMAYEMLFGETPFCGDNQSITFNNILNHEKHFKFPPSANEVSEDVKDLIQHLVCTVEQRLSYNGIVNHRFFLHTDWNNLESVEPPFIPVVTSVDDTSNFDDIDYKESAPNIDDFRAKGVFSGFHLPFVGYTYSRPPVEKKNELRNQDASLNISIPKETSQLETELQTKKKQLHEANLKIQRLSEGGQNRSIVSELEKRAVRAEKKINFMEEEVKNSRKETTHYLQKIKDFENTLKEERSAHKERQNKALDLMREYKERWKKDEEERVKHLMDKVEIYKQSAATLLDNKDEALRQLAEMTHEANKFEENMMKYKQLYAEKVNELNKMASSRLETCNKMDVSISMKTDSNSAKELNKEKEKTMNLKKDLDELKTLKSELEDANQDLKCRLDASESERKNLESEINALRLSLKRSRDDNESLEAELKETREMALKERDSILHDLEVKFSLEQRECYELRIKLQELSQSLNESLATQDSVQNQHESLESKLESTKVELEIIAKAKEDALHELSIVSSREDEQRSKVKELESLLETLKETLNKLETKQVDDVERKNQQKSQGQMELLEKQLKNALEAASADKEKLHLAEKNVRNTGRELSDVKLDLRSSQRELKQSQETCQFLRERSKELKEQIKTKETEINDLELKKKDLEEIIKKKDADISHLEKKNEEMLSETQRLLKKLEDAEKVELTGQSKVDELKKKIVTCQSEADKLKIEKRGLASQLQIIEREREKEQEIEASQKEKLKDLEAKLAHSKSMIESLKEVCTEQDDQLSVVDKFEERIQNVSREKQNLSNEIIKLQSELKLSKSSTNEEKSLRIFQEKRVKDLENKLIAYDIEIDEHKMNSQQEINKIKEDNNELQGQISDMEMEIREIRTNERALEHNQLEQQNIIDVMKGEIEGHIQHIHSMKESNFKLTDGLEQAISKGELYKKRIEECERLATESKIIFDDKELKLKSTIAQQTKLIDFLQSKVENPPKKKATLSRMFGTSTKNKENSGYIIGPQYRKLEDLLAREKEHSKQLSSKLAKIQNENLTLRSQGSSSAGQTQKNVMEDLTNSPSIQDGHPKERMRHKIPHRWQSYLVVRAGRCAGCLGSVPFSRNAVKCHECGLIAHIKCSRNIANTCGLPEGFANHYSRSRAKSNAEGSPSTGIIKNTMKGWIKVPRSGKTSWEKRYACLSERDLVYYDQEPVPSLKPIKTYNLDTNLHKIAVLHSVPTSELQACNRSDLPYVLKIDIRSEKLGMTSNPIYIMTSSFEEKKSWISALENVIHGEGSNDDDVAKGTLEMETLLSLNSVTSLDVNTIVYLNDRTAIIGAVEGLFSFSRDENGRLSFRARIEGVNSVFEILLIKSIGVAVIIGGKDNFLYLVNLELLKVAADASQMAKPSIAPLHIEPQISCHLVSASQHTKRVFICAAAANRISIFLWCSDKQTFEVCRQYSTQEPCSCVQFTPSSLIVGAERFYKISLKNFSIEEYLDETDTSLAYAIYGSAQMSSFPVAIIQVSGLGKHEEYLLVFYEFGIFVDSEGRRSREFDLKFVRLPVGIVFCPPYLYILHHNSVEVMEIKAESFTRVKGLSFDSDFEGTSSVIRSASKMLLKPRFLGNSLDSKSILLATNTDTQIDIVSLRATFSVDPDDESLAWSMNTSIQTQTYMGDSSETASLASEGSFGSSSTLSDTAASSIKRKFPNFMRASKRTKKQDKS